MSAQRELQEARSNPGGHDNVPSEPEGFFEYSVDSQGGVELDAYIPPDAEEDGDEASNVD